MHPLRGRIHVQQRKHPTNPTNRRGSGQCLCLTTSVDAKFSRDRSSLASCVARCHLRCRGDFSSKAVMSITTCHDLVILGSCPVCTKQLIIVSCLYQRYFSDTNGIRAFLQQCQKSIPWKLEPLESEGTATLDGPSTLGWKFKSGIVGSKKSEGGARTWQMRRATRGS